MKGAAPYESPRPGHTPSPMRDDGRPSSADARNREEQEFSYTSSDNTIGQFPQEKAIIE
jgi:hypothetical protein